MTAAHAGEVLLFSLLNFFPYVFLIAYCFRTQQRFSHAVTVAGLAGMLAVHISITFGEALLPDVAGPLSMLCTLIHMLVFLGLYKAHCGKILFTLLILTNLSNFIITCSKMFEGLLFPALAGETHHWSHSLCMLAVQAVLLFPLFLYIKHIYQKALADPAPLAVWRYLWCIPLTFYAVWFRNFYFSAEGALTLMLRPRHTLFSLVINTGALLSYATVAWLINEQAENRRLREAEHLHTLQQAQYTNLHDRIEEARRAKHDLRHHAHVMTAFVKEQKYGELEAYLSQYERSLPTDTVISHCDHFAVNALLHYFTGYAQMIGCGFSVSMSLPRDLPLPDEVLTVVLGNLLENATEACVAAGPGAVVSVRGKVEDGLLFFHIANTCPQKPRTDRKGRFLSSKRPGLGLGLSSVERIATEYNGRMKAGWENGTFAVSVMLTLPE